MTSETASLPQLPFPTAETWRSLARQLEGELRWDSTIRRIYATDASEYQEYPLAVAFPVSEADVQALVRFARSEGLPLIPRTAGTSLAGQVVGRGIVLDLGRHLNAVKHIDAPRRRVRVQPGVVRNELNLTLKPYGLFFAPETSTANRAMIGGMVGNNSCGANSIVYGSTRDHLMVARGFLSDGSEVTFGPLTEAQFAQKCLGDSLEAKIYQGVRDLLMPEANQEAIRENFPKPSVTRRNTGYALDMLLDCAVFTAGSEKPFNLCRLIAGSEGTLFIGVEFELDVDPLPPAGALMCIHFPDVHSSLRAVAPAMARRPSGVELIDRHVLECTKKNLTQAKNRFFVEGDPGAILVVEIRREDRAEIEAELATLEAELRAAGLGYAFPILWGEQVEAVWELRRAGQGLISNVVGDAKPREIVEDTAVAVEDLPAYIAEFDHLLTTKYGVDCVYYAHAGAGELHIRPLFNLKTPEGLKTFREMATDTAKLVKKYRGSLSGEHGDGRLRGEFIPFMVGEACYAMMRRIKELFDPAHIFNPGKIIDTPPMDTSLRHHPSQPTPEYATVFNFSAVQGVVRAAEKCNGSGDCRKSHLTGGTMCPSYMATRREQDTTRARANTLRQVLTHPANPEQPWESEEVASVMDLCLSCKACKSECPSSVDVARLKAEWLQHHYDVSGVPLRSRLIASFSTAAKLGMLAPGLHNWVMTHPLASRLLKRMAGFAEGRSLPTLPRQTVRAWQAKRKTAPGTKGKVHLFCDEFSNYHDAAIGIQAIEVLERLGYEVIIPAQADSGRAQISKGLLREAKELAIRNVQLLSGVVTAEAPLVGIEPSAILGFRDEYPDLMPAELIPAARHLATNSLLFEEFIAREAAAGRITPDDFAPTERTILVHGHCHQKALSSVKPTVDALSLPRGHRVKVIPSGCCGMAGSFGYEAEHFEVSQKVGELVLFPAVRSASEETLIVAPGTSCRHQIHDGTGRRALHPIEVLHEALR